MKAHYAWSLQIKDWNIRCPWTHLIHEPWIHPILEYRTYLTRQLAGHGAACEVYPIRRQMLLLEATETGSVHHHHYLPQPVDVASSEERTEPSESGANLQRGHYGPMELQVELAYVGLS